MRFAEVAGHKSIATLLQRLVSRDRLPHALLLEGIPGCGRRTVALALAQALLCQQPQGGDACGSCDACHLIINGTHPDCTVLPHEREVADIPIDIIREQITEQAFTTPLMGERRVFILPGIERLSSAGANTLLKVLEEPPKGTFIIMTTHTAAGVLTTIRSRAQLYRLSPLSHDAIFKILTTRGMDGQQAQLIAAGARGSVRGFDEKAGEAPLDELETLSRGELRMDLVATVLKKLPQKLTEEMGSTTLAGEQRRILSLWLELLLQRLRLNLASEDTNMAEETATVIERIFRLQHDLQRHINPHIVIEGLALAQR